MRKIGLALAFAAALAAPCHAADVKFSSLPVVATVGGTERLIAIQGTGCPAGAQPCNNVAITPAQLAGYVATASAITSAYQPLNADLTSLASASTIGKIYYRSATGTWSPVLLGANLSLSSGELDVTGLGSIASQDASAIAVTGGTASLSSLIVSSAAPATSSDACSAGRITWDTSYFYVCTASNTWKRAALSTF